MEGIPEEDLRAHEKRLAGKDKDEPDTTDTVKVPPPIGMPPIPPLGMMPTAPMMPMAFPGMPFGITPMPLPMMPVPMMAQMRPPMPIIPPTAVNPTAGLVTSAPAKPLFPSGANDVSLKKNKIRLFSCLLKI
jgi:hypothetical protein